MKEHPTDPSPIADESAALKKRVAELEAMVNQLQEEKLDLEEREGLLRLFIEHSPVPIAIFDREMRYLAYSRRWVKDYNLGTDDLKGRSHYAVFPDIPERWKEEYRQCLAGTIIKHAEEPFPLSDGTVEWVRRELRPWRTSEGKIGGIIMFTEVITSRKQAEEAFRENEEKYRTILDSIEEGYFEVDLDGNILFLNHALCQIMGYPAKELLNTNTRDHTGPNAARQIFDTFNRVYHRGEPQNLTEYEIIRKDETKRVLDMTASLKYDRKGRRVGFRGVVRDVTDRIRAERERKKMEEQLKQAQRLEAVGTLSAGVAHDFNNLLMGIQGNITLMMMEMDSSHPQHEKMKKIEAQVKRGTDLTKQLLGFAMAGQYEVKPIDVNIVVKNTVRMFSRTRKDINFNERYQKDVWTVEADPGQLEQVVLVLCINAGEAMPGGGNLDLSTENIIIDEPDAPLHNIEPGRYVKICVADTGVGMTDDVRQRVFEPFFTTKERQKATGLGLASAFGIIKKHRGIIHAKSEKGKGSIFTIHLPVMDSTKPEALVIDEPTGEPLGTILLIDDEAMILEIVQPMLEKLGYEALTASNGKQGVALYRENKDRIDLVILDMIMPNMNGSETFDELRSIDPGIKVLVASGYGMNGPADKIIDRGCIGFIQKPFRMDILSRKLKRVLER